MLNLKVGDRVRTKLVPHTCSICKKDLSTVRSFHETWTVLYVSTSYVHMGKANKLSLVWTVRDAAFYIDGRGLGSRTNHIIYKINGKYVDYNTK